LAAKKGRRARRSHPSRLSDQNNKPDPETPQKLAEVLGWPLSVAAEPELGVLSSQYLNRRIPDKQILVEEVAAWEQDRNANHAKADWRFTTATQRIKLKHYTRQSD
jgi:hypothetical protein